MGTNVTQAGGTGVSLLLTLLVTGCGVGSLSAGASSAPGPADARAVPVIVTLAVDFTAEPRLTPAQVRRQRAAIRAAQGRILASLRTFSVRVSARFVRIPQLALVVDARALRVLRRHPDVARVQENTLDAPGG